MGRPELAELSLEEHKRAASFAFRSDRRRYTAAHVMLRRVLSGYVDIPPSSLIFRREPCPRCGKPDGPAWPFPFGYGLHFSLAHSGDAVVIAVASGRSASTWNRSRPAVCARCPPDMNAADAESGRLPDEAARHRPVIRWWVRAEAVLKCTGKGIAHGIGAFPVLGSPDGPVGPAVPGGPDRLVAATAAHGCSFGLAARAGRLPGRAGAGRARSAASGWPSGRRGPRRAPAGRAPILCAKSRSGNRCVATVCSERG